MKHKSRHILDYCFRCEEEIVRCVTCGNNCCSGSYGKVDDKVCPDCPEAYRMQEMYYKNPDSISFR